MIKITKMMKMTKIQVKMMKVTVVMLEMINRT